MDQVIRTSVRPLVEYVYRSGDLTTGFRSTSTMTEGTKAHQYIQSQYKYEDQKEVLLQLTTPFRDITFHIEGRCDGVLFQNESVIIEEIKSTQQPLDTVLEEDHPVHWAQAKVYAYIYALQNKHESITVQLTYIQVDTYEQKHFRSSYTLIDLEDFFQHILEQFYPYAQLLTNHRYHRTTSAKALEFPFPSFREGQRYFAGAVYKSISEGKDLFANAPTGTGKTISTLFPAVKAMGEEKLEQAFYLTAKTVTRGLAEDALSSMIRNGLHIKAVTITAKEKICFKEKGCTKEDCPFTQGYFDRINDTLLDALEHEDIMNQEIIEHYGEKHSVCPFELSLDLAYSADVIIGDYNYIFDPRVALKRMSSEGKKKTALLMDESHNLVDRAREMYSAVLFHSPFKTIQQMYAGTNDSVSHAAKEVHTAIASRWDNGSDHSPVSVEAPAAILEAVKPFLSAAEEELVEPSLPEEEHSSLLDAYFAANTFQKIGQLYNDAFVTYVEAWKNEIKVKMLCVKPATLLRRAGKDFMSKIYFSATLMPMEYYRDMLGSDEEDYQLAIPSPFNPAHTNSYILPISTRYRDREASLESIAHTIYEFTHQQGGNHLIFLPSYEYMYRLYDLFQDRYPEVHTLLQQSQMSEAERIQYLNYFQPSPSSPLIGFAVLGGIFSEGIDLKGDKLNGVFIVGVGFPQIGLERNIIKDYFNTRQQNGFDYAYRFPGMNKVLQAGGRLIRTEEDEGIIVLLDDRFLQKEYQNLLPPEWRDYTIIRNRK